MSVLSGASAIQAQNVLNIPATANAAPALSDPTAAPPPPTAPINEKPVATSTVSGETPVPQITTPVIYTAVANVNAPTILGSNVNITA